MGFPKRPSSSALYGEVDAMINDTFNALQIMPCRSRFPWAPADAWALGQDIIIRRQKLGRSLALEAG